MYLSVCLSICPCIQRQSSSPHLSFQYPLTMKCVRNCVCHQLIALKAGSGTPRLTLSLTDMCRRWLILQWRLSSASQSTPITITWPLALTCEGSWLSYSTGRRFPYVCVCVCVCVCVWGGGILFWCTVIYRVETTVVETIVVHLFRRFLHNVRIVRSGKWMNCAGLMSEAVGDLNVCS